MRVTNYCVGELSALDTAVLIRLAKQSTRILEFGVGGSSTLWSQFCPPHAQITCVESNPQWIEKTREMCKKLGGPVPVFVTADHWRDKLPPQPWYDLIFIDDLKMEDRIPLAEKTWSLLMPEGQMAWHDTHGSFGADVFRFLAPRHLEVGAVRRESAITIATKSVETLIGNTDAFEGRAPWESGHAALPSDWPRPR